MVGVEATQTIRLNVLADVDKPVDAAGDSWWGLDSLLVRANPSVRHFPLDRNGTSFVPAPWSTDEGEEATKWLHIYRRRSWVHRPRLVAA